MDGQTIALVSANLACFLAGIAVGIAAQCWNQMRERRNGRQR